MSGPKVNVAVPTGQDFMPSTSKVADQPMHDRPVPTLIQSMQATSSPITAATLHDYNGIQSATV